MRDFYMNNRKKLAETMKDNAILLLFAGAAPKKTADENYKHTPNRNFLYMTGIDEESVILAVKKVGGSLEETLFIKKRDELLVKWVGETISPEKAEEVSGIKDVRFLDTFELFLNTQISKEEIHHIYVDLEKDGFNSTDTFSMTFAKMIRDKYPQVRINNVYVQLSALRVKKDTVEVENIRKAIEITGEGIYNLMKNTKAGMREFELEAYYDFILKTRGVKDFAFTTICASGKNATVLHYVANDMAVKDGELVLLDLGAAFNYYSADISRTFPVNGKFTERQRVFYDIVLKAHDEVIKILKPGIPIADINKTVHEVYAKELKALGLISNDDEVRKYYFHNTSHHLGLDTHDVGRRDGLLEEGMVITVEPGLYIEEESIGIRLENDVLITKEGAENLSKEIIITADDIEEYMKNNNLALNKK